MYVLIYENSVWIMIYSGRFDNTIYNEYLHNILYIMYSVTSEYRTLSVAADVIGPSCSEMCPLFGGVRWGRCPCIYDSLAIERRKS